MVDDNHTVVQIHKRQSASNQMLLGKTCYPGMQASWNQVDFSSKPGHHLSCPYWLFIPAVSGLSSTVHKITYYLEVSIGKWLSICLLFTRSCVQIQVSGSQVHFIWDLWGTLLELWSLLLWDRDWVHMEKTKVQKVILLSFNHLISARLFIHYPCETIIHNTHEGSL